MLKLSFYKYIIPLFALVLLAGCGDDTPTEIVDYNAPGEVADGDMFTKPALAKATNLVPFLAAESSSSDITGFIYEALLEYDKDLNLQCLLCESYDVSEDGTEITFTLKQGVMFHDGMPFTSNDVSATFHALTNPNTRTPYAGDYLLVQSFETPDDYTVKVTYAEPFAPALSSWVSLAVLPAHILAMDEDFNETRLKQTPTGTGPYKLVTWSDTETVLDVNPDYHKGTAHIARVRMPVIPDLDTQFLELKAHNLDMMGLKPLQYTRLTNGADFSQIYNKYKYLGFGYTYLGFNLNTPKFSDARVRKALNFATPREQLINAVLLGQGEAITGPFKPGTWAYNDALEPITLDIEKAKTLLKEAGWTDSNDDGILDKDGKPFSFTLVTNQGNDLRIKTAEILQAAYKELGIKVEILVQEWRTFLENTIYPRNFDAFILGWSLTPEPDLYDIWHSSKMGEREFNIIGFKNARADELLDMARHTFKQDERKMYLDEFQQILHEEQPVILLYAPYSLVALHKRFKGAKPAPNGLMYNFTDWYVPADQQKHVMTP